MDVFFSPGAGHSTDRRAASGQCRSPFLFSVRRVHLSLFLFFSPLRALVLWNRFHEKKLKMDLDDEQEEEEEEEDEDKE